MRAVYQWEPSHPASAGLAAVDVARVGERLIKWRSLGCRKSPALSCLFTIIHSAATIHDICARGLLLCTRTTTRARPGLSDPSLVPNMAVTPLILPRKSGGPFSWSMSCSAAPFGLSLNA